VSAAIEASGLGRRYRRGWALRDCNLTVPRGRIAALVGPNGAGKTTLLHLAVGLLAPTTGGIQVLDQLPGDPGLLARVGFVAQDTPLYRDFTAAEHLTLGVKLNPWFDAACADPGRSPAWIDGVGVAGRGRPRRWTRSGQATPPRRPSTLPRWTSGLRPDRRRCVRS
jgi:ABC-2 type transport system ATP-binding protein